MMRGPLKNKIVIGAAVLATAAFAGGAYAANQSAPTPRQAFLNDVSKRLNVTPQQLKAAMRAAFLDRIDAAVKAGMLTQAQANAIKQRIEQGKLPLFFGAPGFEHRGLFGPRMLGHRGPLSAVASYLGVTELQVLNGLRSGQSLAQIAKAHGKSVDGLEQAILAQIRSRLDTAVAAGRITKAREQELLDRLQRHLGRIVNRTPRFVPPLGAPGPAGPPAGPPGGPPGGPPPPGPAVMPGPPPPGPPPAA